VINKTASIIFVLSWSIQAPAQMFQDQTSTLFPTPAATDFSNQLTIGDIDGDNDLDIIFANGGNFFNAGNDQPTRIYRNNGTGTFTDVSQTQLGFNGLVRGVELGDIDGDGDLDMILVQDFDRQPHLFNNNGNGVFSDVTNTQLPVMELSSSRAQFADIDSDGDIDLYIATGQNNRFGCGQNKILINDGTGTFSDETALRHPLENLCENMDVSIADIDGDFDLDIRVGNRASNSRLYLNNGAGIFTLSNNMPNDSSCYSYDFGDVDGDGDLDLLGANARSGSSAEALFINDGNGSFTDASNQISPNPIGDDDNDSKFLDLDNDGDLDLIIAALSANAEKVYLNDGNGNFTQAQNLITGIADLSLDIMVADLTGDGRLDIVTAQGESGSFINRIYINQMGAIDTRPPRIITTERPTSTDSLGSYPIRVAILDDMSSDRGFFTQDIILHYDIDGGVEQAITMFHSGGQIYRGLIPVQVSGTTINYFVTAVDFAGNMATGQSQSIAISELIFNNGFE
jgi:DNA/RNA endonuclease YhcR with UshA esterase domain